MDFSKVVEDIEDASIFELFRLRVAINRMLEDPERIYEIKDKLILGHRIRFF